MKNLVSVIIPSYNSAHFIGDAIDSIIQQTYSNWELIIVDDGSNDALYTVVTPFLELDQRIRYIKKKNGGLGSARNFGIKHSKGDYILPLDADDKFEKTFIEKAVNSFTEDNELKVVYSNAEFFGTKTGPWKLPDYDYTAMLLSNMIFSCAMFKRMDYDNIDGYNETILYEDWDFWLRLLKDGGKVYKIPEVLFFYRQHHEGSLMNTLTKKDEFHIKSLETIYKNNISAFIKSYGNPIEIELNRRKNQKQLDKPLIKWIVKHKNSILVKFLERLIK